MAGCGQLMRYDAYGENTERVVGGKGRKEMAHDRDKTRLEGDHRGSCAPDSKDRIIPKAIKSRVDQLPTVLKINMSPKSYLCALGVCAGPKQAYMPYS
jgi:hypothetical protein